MTTWVLLPANMPAHWAETVAKVVADVEDSEITAVVLYLFNGGEIDAMAENLAIDRDTLSDVDELARRKSVIDATVDRLQEADIPCEIRGVEHASEPADTIINIAEAEDIDRIYMYSRKRNPTGKAVFGGTLQRVLLDSHVPVVVTPANMS